MWCEGDCEKGWNYEETKQAFDHYFSDKDPGNLSNEALDEFLLEFERATEMLNKGKRSGKVSAEDNDYVYVMNNKELSNR